MLNLFFKNFKRLLKTAKNWRAAVIVTGNGQDVSCEKYCVCSANDAAAARMMQRAKQQMVQQQRMMMGGEREQHRMMIGGTIVVVQNRLKKIILDFGNPIDREPTGSVHAMRLVM